MTIGLEAITISLEATAIRLEAIATRLKCRGWHAKDRLVLDRAMLYVLSLSGCLSASAI